MENKSTSIQSKRLDLVLLEPNFLRLSLAGDFAAAERYLGLEVPHEWYQGRGLISLRLQQITRNPSYQPWSLRAIVVRERRQMVGHIGFHTSPGAAYLQLFAAHGVEFGYSIYHPFRRRGYAREACQALMKWAYEQHQVSEFVVTISPENTPSRQLAQGLGFKQVGSHVDQEDGLEDIFRLDYQGSDEG